MCHNLVDLIACMDIRHVHPAIFGLQLVKARGADAVLAADICDSWPSFLFFDHPNNLRLGETALSHASAPSGLGRPYIKARAFPGGRSEDIIELTKAFGRYGYRMITWMLTNSGWHVNHKRVERIWRQEGLKVPQKQPKKGRLWLNDGSCVRLRPERPNHVWSYDFVQDRTHDGRIIRTLNIIDEFTKEALGIKVKRKLNSTDVVDALSDLLILRGPPEFITSDNGAEFIAKKVRPWIGAVGAKTAFITPGSPWENSYCESCNARFRDELLNGEVFYTLREAQILIERTTPSGPIAP